MDRVFALDGLRTLAIFMVIAYHVDKDVVPTGYWGVILFFVLSGYLITRQLTAEADESGGIDLGSFYLKRALRLLPALIVLCVVLLLLGVAWAQIAPALGHYANYARVAGVDLGVLTHTWFLAVMAHFYLLWPLVIVAVPKDSRVLVVGLIALAAFGWRVTAIALASPGWVYNATDTNAAALLAGCFLAVTRPPTWRVAGLAIPALLGLTLVPFFGEEGTGFLWGDFLAIALSMAIVLYALGSPGWLENRVLLWLGEISYGLYLWHYVLLELGMSPWAAIPLSLAVAAMSWYLIEKPPLRWSGSGAAESREPEQQSATPQPTAAGVSADQS